MNANLELLIPLVFLITFPLFWFVVISLLKKKARMTKHLDIKLGKLLYTTSWGTAVVNGMNARNSLRVKEYNKGYVLEIMWVFGGGKLWLAKDGLQIVKKTQGSFFKPATLKISYKDNNITLYGKLIKAFN